MELCLSDNAVTVLKERYLHRGRHNELIETEMQLFQRVAAHVASAENVEGVDPEEKREQFLKLMLSLDFLPNTPTLLNAGTPDGQLAACFVLPLEDSMAEIFEAVKQSAIIQSSGGGVGFAFSNIRPKQDIVRVTSHVAAGPVAFLEVFDAVTQSIKQSGKRRGANMGVLRIDHPDIEEFIKAKSGPTALTNFNLSIAVTDTFMQALSTDSEYPLVNPRTRRVEGAADARDVFDAIVEMAWSTGDPGMIFLDHINRANPTPKQGDIESTNPCGETPLLPYESCVLGSINLSNMVVGEDINWAKLEYTTRTAVRFLDNIVEVNAHPLPEIKEMAMANRKIGLGVMGWADALIMMGIPYDSEEAVLAAEELMEFIGYHAKSASIGLAQERGQFPNYDRRSVESSLVWEAKRDSSERSILESRPPMDWQGLRTELRQYGIRNATVTTIAPTGSISTIASASSGIEPNFALAYVRDIMDRQLTVVHDLFQEKMNQLELDSDALMQDIVEQGNLAKIAAVPDDIRRIFVTASEVEPKWHVRMQAAFQNYVDNAVSKTVNLPASATQEDVANIYLLAHELCCKGITIYRDGSRNQQVLSQGIPARDQATSFPKPVPDGIMLDAKSFSVSTPTGKMTLFVRQHEGKPLDVFVVLGRSGSDITAFTEAIGRLLSIALRSNIPVDILAENLTGLGGRMSVGYGPGRVLSVPDAIGKLLHDHFTDGSDISRHGEICPECGNTSLEYSEGCLKCPLCGFAEC